MAYELTIHFSAGDKNYSVQRSGFRIESAVGEQGKHRTQSCALSVRSREAGLLMLQEQTRIIRAELMNGTDIVYQGVIRPYRTLAAYGKNEDPLSLEILDYTELLHTKVASKDGKVWSNTNLLQVIEDILEDCDVETTIEAPSAISSQAITYIKANSGEFYDEILAEVLYGYGYDYRFVPNKLKVVKNHMEQGDQAPRILDIRNKLNITRSDSKDDGIEVRYNTYVSKRGAGLVSHTSKEFKDSVVPGVVWSVNNHTGYYYNNSMNSSPTSEKWLKWNPTGFKMGDVVELTNLKIEKYLEGHIWYDDSNYAFVNGYDLEGCAANIYYNTKFATGAFSGGWNFGITVHGDIILKVEHTDSELVNGEEPKVIDARFLDSKTAAKALAKIEARRLADCALKYSFDSLTEYEAGSFYNLVDTVTGVDTTIRILSCTLNADGIYSITAEGAGDVNASVDPVSLSLIDASSDANNWTSIYAEIGTEPINLNSVNARIEGAVLDYITEYGLTFKWYVNDVLMPSLTGTAVIIPSASLEGGANTIKVEVYRSADLIDEASTVILLPGEGQDGATFTPSVDASGNLSWTNDAGLPNPPTVNIKGPAGNGATYWGVRYEAPESANTGDYYVFGLCGNEGEEGEASLEGTVYVLSSGGTWEVMDVTSAENSSKVLTAYTDIIEKKDDTEYFSAPPTLSNTVSHMQMVLANDIIAERIKANEGFFNSIHVTGNSQFAGQIYNDFIQTYPATEGRTIDLTYGIGAIVSSKKKSSISFTDSNYTGSGFSLDFLSQTLENYGSYVAYQGSIEIGKPDGTGVAVYTASTGAPVVITFTVTKFLITQNGATLCELSKAPFTKDGETYYTYGSRIGSQGIYYPIDFYVYVPPTISPTSKSDHIGRYRVYSCSLVINGSEGGAEINDMVPKGTSNSIGTMAKPFASVVAKNLVATEQLNVDGKPFADYVAEYFVTNALLKTYPVGSVYLSVNDTSPASFLGGSWTKLDAGYALWTASEGAGGTINAGLPNIKGRINQTILFQNNTSSGAFSSSRTSTRMPSSASQNAYIYDTSFDAKNGECNLDGSYKTSGKVYGGSDTVQPPAYKVYAWRRTL